MRIHYLFFILIITMFGFILNIDQTWQKSSDKFVADVVAVLDDFDTRLTAKDDLMKRALDAYGTQIHINKRWIKTTIAKIDDNEVKG